MLIFKNFFFKKIRIWIKRLKHTFGLISSLSSCVGLIIVLSNCVDNNFDLPEFFSIKLTFEIVDKERWNVGLAFEIMVCNMQILKVERSDTSLIQGQFSNVCWRRREKDEYWSDLAARKETKSFNTKNAFFLLDFVRWGD